MSNPKVNQIFKLRIPVTDQDGDDLDVSGEELASCYVAVVKPETGTEEEWAVARFYDDYTLEVDVDNDNRAVDEVGEYVAVGYLPSYGYTSTIRFHVVGKYDA